MGTDKNIKLHIVTDIKSLCIINAQMITNDLKSLICSTIDGRSSDLNDISQSIWNKPELRFEEHHAHELLASFLEKEGFDVKRKSPLETSFIARYGDNSGLKVGICCEYDALPGIGHACGHNLITEAGIGAALGIKEALSSSEDVKAELIVLGTPAEEGGGGKIKMIEKGVFDEIDICMMSHPTPYEIPTPKWLSGANRVVTFHGCTSHAASAPWEGINALDAAVSCYNSISMLRQQIKPTSRVHCVITDGGEKPNIIPERSQLNISMRGLTDEDALDLVEKVINCAKGAALATGCSVDFVESVPLYSSITTNKTLIDLYIKNAQSLGVLFNDGDMVDQLKASTDMGNVSKFRPSIHPLFKIKTEGANHTHKFTDAAGHADNQLPTMNSAKAMAMTAIDVICNPRLMNDIRRDFLNST